MTPLKQDQTINNSTEAPSSEAAASVEHGRDVVTIFYQDKPYEIHRGSHSVSEIKLLLKISNEFELVQLQHGEIHYLPDDGKVVIKGGEIFAKHVRTGGNS